MGFESSQDIKHYSINLMWINKNLDPEQDKFLSALSGTLRPTDPSGLDSIYGWAEANPEKDGARICVWYDGLSTSEETIVEFKKQLKYKHITLRNIRDIPIVKKNVTIFSDQFPVYARIDILKCIILINAIECDHDDVALFADFSVGALRKDPKTRSSKDELFCSDNIKLLNKQAMIRGVKINSL